MNIADENRRERPGEVTRGEVAGADDQRNIEQSGIERALVQFDSRLQDIEIYVIYLIRRESPSLFE